MKYAAETERQIRSERLVREWTRSGLITQDQQNRMLIDLPIDMRRTNLFLRLVLFAFGILIIAASVLFVGVVLDINDEEPIAALTLVSAVGCYLLAEFLTSRFRLYRFGIEESA